MNFAFSLFIVDLLIIQQIMIRIALFAGKNLNLCALKQPNGALKSVPFHLIIWRSVSGWSNTMY